MNDKPSLLERVRRIVLGAGTPERLGLSSMIDMNADSLTNWIGQTTLGPGAEKKHPKAASTAPRRPPIQKKKSTTKQKMPMQIASATTTANAHGRVNSIHWPAD